MPLYCDKNGLFNDSNKSLKEEIYNTMFIVCAMTENDGTDVYSSAPVPILFIGEKVAH